MLSINKDTIRDYNRIYRLNLINAITGYKPANLIGSKSLSGKSNLAIFSSVVHLGSDPALLAFMLRPQTVPRHTFENIKEIGFYTINHVNANIIEKAHYTSADFDADVSEFEQCHLSEEYLNGFYAPFVAEANIKIAIKFEESIEVKLNNTLMVIGSIEAIHMTDNYINENGQLDLNRADTACISGLDIYHKAQELARFPYARPNELPDFA
jgi:flavin reductase (DIM6/NTAB) family NADH-FMN oxidoreductase RutF